MKKNKLTVAPFDDIHLIGINSTLVDYKLAYHFNNSLKFNFIRLEEILLDNVLPYSFFYYNAGENNNAYNLVAMRNKEHVSVKLNPQIDYLLIVRNHITEDRLKLLVNTLFIPGFPKRIYLGKRRFIRPTSEYQFFEMRPCLREIAVD